jgi:hypothetical protein
MSGGSSIAAGYGDPIESYCAIKIALLSYVTHPERARTIVRSYRYLNERPSLPGTFIQTQGLDGAYPEPWTAA